MLESSLFSGTSISAGIGGVWYDQCILERNVGVRKRCLCV